MAFFVFDLDGTLRDVSHRRKYVAGPKKDYRTFFKESINDPPIKPVIEMLRILVWANHEVEIWSGCSDEVLDETERWLNTHIGLLPLGDHGETRAASELLTHMRPSGNYTPDTKLKEGWLHASIAKDRTPLMIFDDRQSVVDMWRKSGIICAQVAPGDFDTKKEVTPPRRPTLTVMIGPSGAGKSTYVMNNSNFISKIVSSDDIRNQQFGYNSDAYTPAGFNSTFTAVNNIISARLKGGLDVVYDATNLRRKTRVDLLNFLDFNNDWFDVKYIIVDRPLEEKLKNFRRTNPAHTNEDVIKKQHETFQSSRRDALNGDGYDNINVRNYSSSILYGEIV